MVKMGHGHKKLIMVSTLNQKQLAVQEKALRDLKNDDKTAKLHVF